MPDTFEFPGVLRAVIPLMRADFAFVNELVARARGKFARDRCWRAIRGVPGFAAVIRTLDDLPKPAARLRRINAVRINGRAFEMIHLPAREMRPADFPILALAVGGQNERTFLRANQYSDLAHGFLLF